MPTCLALAADGRSVAVPLRLIGGADATLAMCRMRLESIRGDWKEDANMGLPWRAWLDDITTPPVVIEGEIRRQLLDVPGLVEVVDVTASQAGDALSIAVTVSIEEAGALTLYRIGDPVDIDVPGAWYTVVDPTTRRIAS